MKKTILILTLLVVSLFAEDWLDYDEALAKAKKENKIVMAMLSQEGCPACTYMHNMILKNSEISGEVAKNFIYVELDIHEDAIPAEFDYIGTPTFHFVNKNGKKIDAIYGRLKAESFIGKLKRVAAKK